MLIPFKRLPTKNVAGIIHIAAHEAEEIHDYLRKGVKRVVCIQANPAKTNCYDKRLPLIVI
jgi:hypothetical protein